MDYRAGKKEELEGILRFLESAKDREWFTRKLLDKPIQNEGDLWGSGAHEWMGRCLIIQVLERSAGMVDGVEAETGIGCTAPDYDWLYYHATIRSNTKYVLFKNNNETIENGHVGAVKPIKCESGFACMGSPGFHHQLADAFDDSKTIEGWLKRIENIFKQTLYSGKKKIHESETKKYLIDGTRTSNLTEIGLFRKKKLFQEGYSPFRNLLASNIHYATHFGDNVQEDISEVASDTTDEDTDDDASDDLNESFDTLSIL